MNLTWAFLPVHFKDSNTNGKVPSVVSMNSGNGRSLVLFFRIVPILGKQGVPQGATLHILCCSSDFLTTHGAWWYFFSFFTSSYGITFPVTRDPCMSKCWWKQVAEHWHGFRANICNLQSPSPFGMSAETFCREQSSICLLFSYYPNLLVPISVYFSVSAFWQALHGMCNPTDWWARQNNRYSCLWNWIPKLNWNEPIYTRQLKEVIKSFSCHQRHHTVPFCKFSKLHLKSSWIFSPLYSCWKAVTESNCSQWLGALF